MAIDINLKTLVARHRATDAARVRCSAWIVSFLVVCAFALLPWAVAARNVADPSLGAVVGTNGYFRDPGYAPAPAHHVIDGDWYTYWAGLAHVSPQMIWIDFDRTYEISRVVFGERRDAFVRSGLLEYFDGWRWSPVAEIDKTSPGFVMAFPPVEASAIRLTVYAVTAPSSWYNRVAAITQIEVYGERSIGATQPPPPACRDGRMGLNINDGLEVTGFLSRSPAQRAGLRFGDIIRSIDGVPVTSIDHAQSLTAGPPGMPVTITVWRHTTGRTLTFTVVLECL